MKITSEIPESIIEQAIDGGVEVSRVAKEALLIELFRRNVIDHAALRNALGRSLLDTDEMLKERGIPIGERTRKEQIERNQPIVEFLDNVGQQGVGEDWLGELEAEMDSHRPPGQKLFP